VFSVASVAKRFLSSCICGIRGSLYNESQMPSVSLSTGYYNLIAALLRCDLCG